MIITSWKAKARRKLSKKAPWINSGGVYVLYTWCRVFTVTICSTKDEAEKAKKELDKHGCGCLCTGNHEIAYANVESTN